MRLKLVNGLIDIAIFERVEETEEERLQNAVDEYDIELVRGMTINDEWVIIPKKEFEKLETFTKKMSESGKKAGRRCPQRSENGLRGSGGKPVRRSDGQRRMPPNNNCEKEQNIV